MDRLLEWVRTSKPSKIAILTGAGVSAESGIPTFRGPGGLWENHRAEDLATPEAFEANPTLVWRWYEWRRRLIADAQPNPAHVALAELEAASGAGLVTLITQNVDGLHRRAGSKNIIELHGNITRARCLREHTLFDHPQPFEEQPPLCECGSLLRPDVVWFGEALPEGAMESAAAAVHAADLLLVIGTSAVVYPAAGLVHLIGHGMAVEVNPDATPASGACHFRIRSSAAVAVPTIVRTILEGRR